MNLGLIITAAGSSSRFGQDKLFIDSHGEPLISKTIKAFSSIAISTAVLTHHPDQKQKMLAVLKNLKLPFPITLVEGGKTRKESVETAVYALGEVDAVLIHDGARPNVSTALINRVLDAGKTSNAVIPGLKVTDTVKWVENGTVVKTIDRNFLVRVQTPQYFEFSTLKNAYKQAMNDATDEAMLLESLGIKIMVVDGEEENVKITYPEDKKFLG